MISERFGLIIQMRLALFVVVAASSPSMGQEVKIVVPNSLESVEGDVDGTTESTPFRIQILAPSSEFIALPETHRTIIGVSFRPDQTITGPRTSTMDDSLWRLSTTSNAELDPVFDQNVGGDVTTVLNSSVTVSTDATGPAEGPRGFDYFVEFDTPFVYDPDAGNLLVDVVSLSGQSPTLNEDFDSSVAAIWNSDPSAMTGTQLSGSVLEWVFVPEPSTLAMAIIGAAGFALLMRKRRSHP